MIPGISMTAKARMTCLLILNPHYWVAQCKYQYVMAGWHWVPGREFILASTVITEANDILLLRYGASKHPSLHSYFNLAVHLYNYSIKALPCYPA